MAKFKGYVRTNKIKSDCEFEFEIDDEELADMDEDEIDEIAFSAMCESGMMEWGFEKAP